MIENKQVIPMVLEACPSFQDSWDKSEDKELPYVVMGDLAHHLLTLYRNKKTEEFNPLSEVIEKLHTDGNDEVKTLATIGILEGIQNVWGHSEIDPENFTPFLLPVSKQFWVKLNDFWGGK